MFALPDTLPNCLLFKILYQTVCFSRYFVEIPPIWETEQSLANVHRIAVDQSVAQYTGGLAKVSDVLYCTGYVIHTEQCVDGLSCKKGMVTH